MKDLFLLDSSVAFLNFGSFGACPKEIFEVYQNFQLELEREPVQFIAVNGPAYMKKSREALASYIGCDADDVVYAANPTFAINIIAKNINLGEGDEILSTALEYGAMDRTWNYYCKKNKARYVRQPISLPLKSSEQFQEEFWKGYSTKTKAIFISQITSATGLILPVKEICDEAKRRGLFTMVDGAHVPGHIPLNLSELKADVYTGACHKWMMTPKGSSFLYVKREYQENLDPLVISWGYEADYPSHSKFLDYHQFNGTRDFSAYLTIPAAIRFMEEHHWTSVAASCRKMVIDNAQRFCELLHTTPLAPLREEFIGQMLSLPVDTDSPEKLQKTLFENYKIEIPVTKQDGKYFIRYSINAFNTQEDLDRLFDALSEIRMTTGLIKSVEKQPFA
jgi:isopenicillin-N epimerase